MFVEAYGAEAGNLALRGVATSGVFVGGGIAPKILPALQDGRFIEAFRAKGAMSELAAKIPGQRDPGAGRRAARRRRRRAGARAKKLAREKWEVGSTSITCNGCVVELITLARSAESAIADSSCATEALRNTYSLPSQDRG